MDINSAVARQAKSAREARKLTLDAAAATTGVSRSMLAQIEKGDVNPTISVLWKIAKGYKVSFTSLVDDSIDAKEFIPCAEPLTDQGNGKYRNYPTFPFDDKKMFEMYRIVIDPGGALESMPHLDASEEYVTVFSGALEICVGDEAYELKLGDSLRFNADMKHSYKNISNEPVQLSMLISYKNV